MRTRAPVAVIKRQRMDVDEKRERDIARKCIEREMCVAGAPTDSHHRDRNRKRVTEGFSWIAVEEGLCYVRGKEDEGGKRQWLGEDELNP